jgi:hypothetical protein
LTAELSVSGREKDCVFTSTKVDSLLNGRSQIRRILKVLLKALFGIISNQVDCLTPDALILVLKIVKCLLCGKGDKSLRNFHRRKAKYYACRTLTECGIPNKAESTHVV